MLGMKAVLQLEERVRDKGPHYHTSGNVLLGGLIGAEHMSYPEGEDEEGSDAALHDRAAELETAGRRPYVIHLGLGHPPLGALGCASPLSSTDINISDAALAPGYGQIGSQTRAALDLMVQSEGILLDPVYSGKTFASLLALLQEGRIAKGQKVVLLHTGGQSALFAYQEELTP